MITLALLVVYLGWIYWRSYIIRGPNGTKYLTRIILARTPWFRVFVHRIWIPDQDRYLHNHPWEHAFALILWGGYVESVYRREWPARYYGKCYRRHERFEVSKEAFKPRYFHRITRLLSPTVWTLFIAGRRSRNWGFLTPAGKYIPAEVYLKGYKPLYD